MPESERFRRQAVSPEEALRRILAYVKPVDAEVVNLSEAWRRRLTETMTAPHPYPPFRRSGMDGYAVRGADLPVDANSAPVMLRVLESIPAGTVPQCAVGPGEASRIMTGGMMPEGADTVVMLEMTSAYEREGVSFVKIGKPVPKGRNVSEIGSELREGEVLFHAGRTINAGETALLAAFGCAQVSVARRPRVGVLSTGSELLDVGAPESPGQIRNSNTPMLAALLREAGAEPVLFGCVPDQLDELEARVRLSLSACDLLLTTGGVSVGDYDRMADLLACWEGQMLFNKVTMRPGSPTTAAVLDGKLLLALSGNPGACFVGFQLFAMPAIRKLLRDETAAFRRLTARLATPYLKTDAYTRYVRSRIELIDGTVWVRPVGEDKSSYMKTIPDAVCLMEIPPRKETLAVGEIVTVIPIREATFG